MHWRYCSLALAQRISSNGLVQGCSISIANALEILQACTKQTICEWNEYIVLLGHVKRAQTVGIKVTDNSRCSTDRFTWEAPTPPGIAPVWGLGQRMKKSCHGNLFRIAGPFWGKSHWIPTHTGSERRKCEIFFVVCLKMLLHKRSGCRWFKVPWRWCNAILISYFRWIKSRLPYGPGLI